MLKKPISLFFVLALSVLGCSSDVTSNSNNPKDAASSDDSGVPNDMGHSGDLNNRDDAGFSGLCDTRLEDCSCAFDADCTFLLGSKPKCVRVGPFGSECEACETNLDCPFGFGCGGWCQGPLPCSHSRCVNKWEGYSCHDTLKVCGHEDQLIPDDLSLYPDRVDMGPPQDMN